MREVGGEIKIARLTEKEPANPDQLLEWLNNGNLKRTQHPTDANAQSSRSHAVFIVTLKQNQGAKVSTSKLTLVDLAGSERATATSNKGVRLREGANINKSLLALGNVINSLADPKHKGHINYRDSKLTRILKDGLGKG
jgi:kinesin family protein 18/19